MRKWLIWNLTGVIFCVIGAVIIVKTLFQAGFEAENFSTARYVTNAYDVEEAFSNLSVKGEIEDVILVTSEDDKCHVTFREEEKAPGSAEPGILPLYRLGREAPLGVHRYFHSRIRPAVLRPPETSWPL